MRWDANQVDHDHLLIVEFNHCVGETIDNIMGALGDLIRRVHVIVSAKLLSVSTFVAFQRVARRKSRRAIALEYLHAL